MNRKQRRATQSQAAHTPTLQVHGKPRSIDEINQLAINEYGLGNIAGALDLFHLITANAPERADAWYSQGFVLQMLQRHTEALASYNRAIAVRHDYAEAHGNRGVILQDLKRYGEALASYDKAIALNPHNAGTYNNRGEALRNLGRYEEALLSLEKAVAISPDNAGAYNNLGVTLRNMKRYEEALASLDKAITLVPDYAEAYLNRGAALQNMKRYEEALQNCDAALALKPDLAVAYNNRGDVLRNMKRYEDAAAHFDKALELDPSYAEAYNNRGVALHEMKRYEDALASYDKALRLKPDDAEAYNNLGITHSEMKRYEDAAVSFTKAAKINPDIPTLLGSLTNAKMHVCDWHDIQTLFEQLAKKIGAGQLVSPPFNLLSTPLQAARQRACTEIYVQNQFPPSATPLWKGEKYAHDRIRIGYFSSDLRHHALSYLMAEFFELHDRAKFEITAFSFAPPTKSVMRARLEKAFDRFIDVHDQSEEQIADLARSLEIDIAVDLNGFTQGARTGIFALRPAPVQMSYMGFPATMGASYIDYLMADAVVIPKEHKRYYAEKIVHLPHSYWVVDSSRKPPEKKFTRGMMGLPEQGFVFCCFNNSYKISPDVFDIWMRLLHKVEGSVLWLLNNNEAVTKNLRTEAAKRGIEEHRLVFADRMNVEDHLARHHLADLFLDTFYYNAHTTTSDALWAGLPVVTCLGETFAGRVAASLLKAANLPELVMQSRADYEALALELATHPQALAALRDKLSENRPTCPLFDTKLFTHHFEAAFVKMHERSQAGLLPEDMVVPA